MGRRSSKQQSSKVDAAKALPWAALAQLVLAIGRRWRGLSAKERERLRALVGESRGRVGSLSGKERKELRKLVGKLDLKGLGRDLIALRAGGARRGRRRRA
jgi:hypothetical protein